MNWHELFSYCEGKLYWKVSSGRAKSGDIAGSFDTYSGYVYVQVKYRHLKAATIIWEMHNGKLPDGYMVDHINHIRTDDRLENLRAVSSQDNNRNRSRASNNTSGATGVRYEAGKWRVRIKINGKLKHLGRFNTFDEAVEARELANNEYGFHSNHGKD